MRWLLVLLLLSCSGSTLRRDLLDGGSDAGGTWLEGWVVDNTTDAGMPGAQVFVGVSQVQTDSDGYFSAPVADTGLQSVQVTAPNYWDGLYMVQILPGQNLVQLNMERDCDKLRCPTGFFCGYTYCELGTGPAAIVGQVTDFCDFTNRVALVEVTDNYGTVGTCTDADGHFRITGRLGGERLGVKISAPGYEPYETLVPLKAGDNDASASISRNCSGAAPAQACR